MSRIRVLLCAPCDGHSNLYISNAFKQLGHHVHEFDYRTVWETRGEAAMNENFGFLAKSADLTLILKGELLSLSKIKSIHPCVLWNFDSWYAGQADLLERAAHADLFLTPSGGLINYYQKNGINARYLAEGADPSIHKPIELNAQDKFRYGSDVAFIGTVKNVADRAHWLKAIGQKHHLKIWGSFSDPICSKWHMNTRADGDTGHNKVVSATKILLDKTRTPEIVGAVSARVYRTLAAGGFLLMRKIKGLEEQFVDGKHLVTYVSTDDCLDKIEKYLDTPFTRKQISDEGKKEVLAKHSWLKRIEQLLQLI